MDHVFGYSAEEAISQRIRRGGRIDHFETVRQRKQGSLIVVSLTVSPVKNAEGKIVGASKIARHITEQKLKGAGRDVADPTWSEIDQRPPQLTWWPPS